MKIQQMVWRPEVLNRANPCIAVEVNGGTFGVWAVTFGPTGKLTGAARPVGSGCRMTRDEAVEGAKASNLATGGPSVTGAYQR